MNENIQEIFQDVVKFQIKVKQQLNLAMQTRDFEPAEAADDLLEQSDTLLAHSILIIKKNSFSDLTELLQKQKALVEAQQMLRQQQNSIMDSILNIKQFSDMTQTQNNNTELYNGVEDLQNFQTIIQSNLSQGKDTVLTMNQELVRLNVQSDIVRGRAQGISKIFGKGGTLALKIAAAENKHCIAQTVMVVVIVVVFIIIFVVKVIRKLTIR